MRPRIIGVIGGSDVSLELYKAAELIGRDVAGRQAVLITGGLSGVMEAAAKGAKAAGGLTVGVLPGFSPDDANPYIDLPIVTGVSEARNVIIVRTAEALIAVGRGYGTLSEIAFALRLQKPVISFNSWEIADIIIRVHTPQEAVVQAFAQLEAVDAKEP